MTDKLGNHLGLIAVGRNEGPRLRKCLESVQGRVDTPVYVDSNSTDNSVDIAREFGVNVVELDPSTPLSVARARNAGFARLTQLAPDLRYVHFVDGDCVIEDGWIEWAVQELDKHDDIVAICGQRREMYPNATIWNRLADLEWKVLPGDAESFGGDAIVRAEIFRSVGGFNEVMLAEEDPELYFRIRRAGHRVIRVDRPMTQHDAAMTRFGQWWIRTLRVGYGYGEAVTLHGFTSARYRVRQLLSTLLWGGIVPLLIIGSVFAGFHITWIWAVAALLGLGYVLIAFRNFRHRRKMGDIRRHAALHTVFNVFGKLPQFWGVLTYGRNRLRGHKPGFIQYKDVQVEEPIGSTADGARAKKASVNRLRVAYLINQYPKVTHSFIRREIRAIEARGCQVTRYSVRRCAETLVDPADKEELEKTTILLDAGTWGLILATFRTFLGQPIRFLNSLTLAIQLGWRSDRGCILHLVYFAEACLLRFWLAAQSILHLHCHFGTNPTTVAMLCRRLGGPPYSFTVHGPEEFDKATILGLSQKIEHAQFVSGISEFSRSQLFRQCRQEHWGKIHVVRCGLDECFLETKPMPISGHPRLICIGRICEQKGQLLLIEATQSLIQEGLQFDLYLVGDGEMRPQAEAMIQRYDLKDHVTITGWTGAEQIREYLGQSRALVLPSFAEGLPVVIMEALACGRPVISTYVAGIPELIEDGKSGWLVPAGSIPALQAAMREAITLSPEQLQSMGQIGRERVRKQHDAMVEAGKLLEYMEGAIPDRKHGDESARLSPDHPLCKPLEMNVSH